MFRRCVVTILHTHVHGRACIFTQKRWRRRPTSSAVCARPLLSPHSRVCNAQNSTQLSLDKKELCFMVERFSERNLWPDCVIFVKIPFRDPWRPSGEKKEDRVGGCKGRGDSVITHSSRRIEYWSIPVVFFARLIDLSCCVHITICTYHRGVSPVSPWRDDKNARSMEWGSRVTRTLYA